MPTDHRLKLGGHRGLGCTDHERYSHRDIQNLPVENSAESIEAAYDTGADYTETDAVDIAAILSAIHNVLPADHFFGDTIPRSPLNRQPFDEVAKYPVGRSRKGKLARFDTIVDIAARKDPHTLPWAINIEIKGVQGSKQPYETDDYLERLAKTVQGSALPPERVLFSSFCFENILRMSHLLPNAKYGMLFTEKQEASPIYADHQDDKHYQYLPFNVEQINYVHNEWLKCSKAKLGYLHPEILTIGEAQLDLAAEKQMGINCWAIFEEYGENRTEIYKETIAKATERNVPFTVITDYLPEMKALQNDPAIRAISPV